MQHPLSDVLGTDLSAIQPEFVPPNCHFEIDDAEDDWTFSKKFGFIHGRALLSCFEDPKSVIGKAYDALAPGGFLELQDGIFPMRWLGKPPIDSHLYRWNSLIIEAAERAGRPWTNVQYYAKWMKEKGFDTVEEKMFFWPQSPWAKGRHLKVLSQYFQADMLQGLEGMTLKLFVGMLGWSREAVLAFLVGVREDFKNTDLHAYIAV
jgi:SAM-dependent methyltransferase